MEQSTTLVIAAHPDDAELWAGGTIALWSADQVRVVYCVVTDGDKGAADERIADSDIPRLRREEQRLAAASLGVQEVFFLGHPEGEVTASRELRLAVTRIIRRVRPSRVLTWSPEWNWEQFHSSHPDHRATGELALASIYPDASNPRAHEELLADGLTSWFVSEFWLMGTEHPNHFVDITDVFDRKVAAIRLHKSQFAGRDNLESAVASRSASQGKRAGLPTDRLAESFRVVINKG